MLWRLIPLFLLLTACQVSKRPDLAQLYQQHGTDHSDTPLILIHGTMGSKLRFKDSLEEVWPGKINQLIFSNYKKLANLIDPETNSLLPSAIESYGIFDSYSGLSVYDEVINTLLENGGYQLNDISNLQAKEGRNLYVFHYDWRQDNVSNAQLLAQYIAHVLEKHPKHQQVDVVAHSMGGLILRYFQRFGAEDVLDELDLLSGHEQMKLNLSQTDKIRHAIFLGTPQLGSVKSVVRLLSGFDFNLRNVPVEVQITMPSVYQLLPHPQSHWLVDIEGHPQTLNLYDPKIWQDNLWSIYNPEVQSRILKHSDDQAEGLRTIKSLEHFFVKQLTRANSFWRALSAEFEVKHEGFVIMGGDCNKTLSRLLILNNGTHLSLSDNHLMIEDLTRRALFKSALYEPGDGQVTKSSLLGQIHNPITHQTIKTINIKYPVFVCEDHIKLTQNLTFQDNLLHILLNE